MNPIEPSKVILEDDLSLQHIVRRLLANFQPVATKRNSLIINDVPPGLTVMADEKTLSVILESLLEITSRLCKDTCIKICAKAYHDVILMHIKDTNTSNSYAIHSELEHLQSLTGKIGGYIELTSQRKKVTTIAFSFINHSEQHSLQNQTDKLNEQEDFNEMDFLRA